MTDKQLGGFVTSMIIVLFFGVFTLGAGLIIKVGQLDQAKKELRETKATLDIYMKWAPVGGKGTADDPLYAKPCLTSCMEKCEPYNGNPCIRITRVCSDLDLKLFYPERP